MTDPIRLSNVAQGNAAAAPGGLVVSTKEDEMAAFDALGPACQKALGAAILPWSAEAVLRQHRKRGWNPKDPVADAKLAVEFVEIDINATIKTAEKGHPIREKKDSKEAPRS